MQLVIIGFINLIFLSHLSYVVVEKKAMAYRSRKFWALISGLLLSMYLTIWYNIQNIADLPW